MYRIYVYAICKNEEKFAERWVRSMQEADGICVLDTGSTDGTAERLRELGAHVTQEAVTPWRFDTARNRSLELVPEDADLCVCTDLDEVFRLSDRVITMYEGRITGEFSAAEISREEIGYCMTGGRREEAQA